MAQVSQPDQVHTGPGNGKGRSRTGKEMRFRGVVSLVCISILILTAGCLAPSPGTSPDPAPPPTGAPVPMDVSPGIPTSLPSPVSSVPSKTVVSIPRPIARFSANSTAGKVPHTVRFSDASAGTPVEWDWDFGDGERSVEQNPVHTYSRPGTYTMTLRVSNSGGSDIERKIYYITIDPASQPPGASFSGDPPTPAQPFTVQFRDRSTGPPTNWSWSFGDGGMSTEQDPVHAYPGPGTYTVTLQVSNDAGSSTTQGFVVLG